MPRDGKLNFERINKTARQSLHRLVHVLLPGGVVQGGEYEVLNPRRLDRRRGSFKVNLNTGRWADFAMTGIKGGDVISLAAYIWDCSQFDAAYRLARLLGIKATND